MIVRPRPTPFSLLFMTLSRRLVAYVIDDDRKRIHAHLHQRRRAFHVEILRARDPVHDIGIRGNLVEGETLTEDVAKVERHDLGQHLQTEHREQFADSGIDFDEPALRGR